MDPMYSRSTSRTTLQALPPELRGEVEREAEANQLTVAADSPAWVTHSVNLPKGGLFKKRANPVDPDAEHDTVVVLGGADVVIVVSGEKRGLRSLTLPLRMSTVSTDSALGGGLEPGVAIKGFAGDNNSPGSFYIGLGTEPAADEMVRELIAAVTAAKAP